MAMVSYDITGEVWNKAMDKMFARGSYIIALRGAGSFNGISVADANRLLEREIFPLVELYSREKPVTFIFDGDNDDPQYPDIGHIAGRLRDHFDRRAVFYGVQMLGWYRYRDGFPVLRPLHTASGNEYETVVFPDKVFPGDHSYFSQHDRLAHSHLYEQWYVGACGKIAHAQLDDYNKKAGSRAEDHRVLIFPLPVSVEQEDKIKKKLAVETDPVKHKRLSDSLIQRRENPFGLLCDKVGEVVGVENYENLSIEVIR